MVVAATVPTLPSHAAMASQEWQQTRNGLAATRDGPKPVSFTMQRSASLVGYSLTLDGLERISTVDHVPYPLSRTRQNDQGVRGGFAFALIAIQSYFVGEV